MGAEENLDDSKKIFQSVHHKTKARTNLLLFLFFYLASFSSSSERNLKLHKRTAARFGQ